MSDDWKNTRYIIIFSVINVFLLTGMGYILSAQPDFVISVNPIASNGVVPMVTKAEVTVENVYNIWGKNYKHQIFLNSEDPGISELTVELLSPRYFLSENWEVMHKIIVPVEEGVLKDAVEKSVFHLKNKKVLKMIDDNQKKIKAAHEAGGDYTDLMEMEKKLQSVKMEISKVLGIDILK